MASSHIGKNNEVQKELWMACAGPFVNVPVKGEKVFYFPQGHIEQLQQGDSTSKNFIDQQFSKLNLPDKMLCRVVHFSLKVDRETDEIYAIIKLHPSQEPLEASHDNHPPAEERNPSVRSFHKILTTSDTNRHYAFYVLKKHAEKCFPLLDYSQPQPTQELIAKDLHGHTWRFTHVYRGKPRRHVITQGWKKFVRQKGLVVGDALIFVRGPNNELRIGIRRLEQRIPMILSNESQIGVLANASQALYKKKEFTVYYNPRAFPFLVGLQKYLKPNAYNFSSGINVIMRVKGGKHADNEKRGVIVDQRAISTESPTSEWRSIKVQWNVSSRRSSIQMPEWVSAWQLETVLEDVHSHVREALPSRNTRSWICDDGPMHYANAIQDESFNAIPSSSVNLADIGKERENPKVLRLFGVDISVTTSHSTSETN